MNWSIKYTIISSYISSYAKGSGWNIVQFEQFDFSKNSPNDYSHKIMKLLQFWAKSDIKWSKKWVAILWVGAF